MDWIGCGSEYTWSSWIGLEWVSQLVDWVGLDLAKWTHVQLWCKHAFKLNDNALILLANFVLVSGYIFFYVGLRRLYVRYDKLHIIFATGRTPGVKSWRSLFV